MATASGRRGAVVTLAAPETSTPAAALRGPEAAEPAEDEADPAAAFRLAAQGHAREALEALASLVKSATSEAVRVSAANALIDRAHGRPAQAVRVGAGEAGPDDSHSVVLKFEWLDPAKS